MLIAKLMSTNPVTVGMDDPLSHVKALFDKTGFRHLLVIENEKLVGIISDRDLLKVISPNVESTLATAKDLASLNRKAHQIMTRKPYVLETQASLKDAINLFNAHKISCIPVVSRAGRPLGVLSWRDIIRALASVYDKR